MKSKWNQVQSPRIKILFYILTYLTGELLFIWNNLTNADLPIDLYIAF